MEIDQKHLTEAVNLINRAKKILLVSHKRPDGDTLGASIALHLGLAQIGKKTVLACIDDIPQRFKFLPKSDEFVREFNLSEFDLIIISDAGAYHMTGFHEKYPGFLSKQIPVINIDHHASNEGFGTVNIVNSSACSAAVLVWCVSKALNVKLTKEIAICLLTGIYNDTGSFMHTNTSKETFEVAYELAQAGINISGIVKPMFKRSSFAQLKLWGYILENVRKNEDNVLSAVVSEADFKLIGAHQSDTGGIIDLLNTVPGTSYSVLIAEDNNFVKGSLRTQRDDVNLSDIAGQFGGGGHAKAAGFRIHGKLEKKVIWRIVPAEETRVS